MPSRECKCGRKYIPTVRNKSLYEKNECRREKEKCSWEKEKFHSQLKKFFSQWTIVLLAAEKIYLAVEFAPLAGAGNHEVTKI
jgi:hypothetical protein